MLRKILINIIIVTIILILSIPVVMANNIDLSAGTINEDNDVNDSGNNEIVVDKNNELSSNSNNVKSKSDFYDKISENELDLLLTKLNVGKVEDLNSGILIADNADLMLKFINGHTSYTYNLNNKYLTCNQTLKENNNFDYLVPTETEMDIEIKSIIDNKTTIISVSTRYYMFDDNKISKVDFNENKYVKSYEAKDVRIIILNSNYYNNTNSIDYNMDLADSFIKSLNNVQYKVATNEIKISKEPEIQTRSSRFFKAPSIGHQTVWGGPNDNGTYAIIGSIDDKEEVYILGKEDNYYHIQYVVTAGSNQGKERTGYVLRSNLDTSLLDLLLIHEENMIGGYRYATTSVSVLSCDDTAIAINSGSLASTEGVTLLYNYQYSDSNKNYSMSFVEYGTANGMKRAYVLNDNLSNPFSSILIKSPARVVTYTGPDSEKFSVDTGAVGLNEYSCAIGYKGDYIFLEYNTTNGRRRAFAKASELGITKSLSSLEITELPEIVYTTTYSSTLKQNVSAGPGACYTLCAYRGVIGKKEPVYEAQSSNPVYNQLNYTYIVYHVGNAYKGGYVLSNTLELNVNPTLPELPVYDEGNGEFQRTYIGTTGYNQPLYAYKIGIGKNKVYLCFNQHGWEDGGNSDGIELVHIALDLMNFINTNKSNNSTDSTTSNTTEIENINMVNLLQKWTIYVIPTINRDGITSGWTNSGPGRTDVATRIDINRNWDTEYYVAYTNPNDGRNYTGNTKMATASCKALSSYLLSDEIKPNSKYKSILLDIHGWDGEIIGYDSTSKRMGSDYFIPQFNNSNMIGYSNGNSYRSRQKADTGAGGYIIRWAIEKLNTTTSMIVELPLKTDKTIDHNFVVENNYSRKLTTAILNMLKNEYN